MNDELSNKIMEQIDTDNIAPLPIWRFHLLNSVFGLLAILSVIVGSFAFGAMLFLLIDFREHGLFSVPYSVIDFLLIMPYLWLFVLALFIAVAKISLQHTRRGYRYRLRTVAAVSIILSIIFGSILTVVGITKVTHEYLNNEYLYNLVTYDSRDAWNRPVIGRLAGIITSIQDNNNFTIADFNGSIWQVRLATSTNDSLFVLETSSTIRMVGIFDASSSLFIATSIYKWE